ncbi:HD domain-containing protein [Nonomuraea antri]|uniref:HD domain-containing protein n=1 Tax=Nonomuraea antri TaxID=2730852 RepID=UPI002E2C39E9|nr:HD domain-containing protein [Nonomuraea antri]
MRQQAPIVLTRRTARCARSTSPTSSHGSRPWPSCSPPTTGSCWTTCSSPDEYENRMSPEAECARDADKLDCAMQAIEYRDQGHQNVQSWIDTSVAALTTETAKRLAEEIQRTGSLEWLAHALNGGSASG